ncbi:MAG TPA: DUF3108 domain-containing protein [Anaeromyxobacteraceae bacterium]|nr:DUF3108 domain-containing protein [Anaeromyxobacteraceae bacterium]
MRLRSVAAIALAAAALPAAAQSGFQPGEQIDLAVEFLGIRTGEARITVGTPEGQVWPVICQARTDGVASLLDIREHLVSYWVPEERASRGNDLSALELGDRHQDSARFDRLNGKATVRISRKGRQVLRVVDVPRDSHDVAGAVLWLRMQKLEPGSHYEIPLFTGSRVFTLVADALGVETVKTPAGSFETVKVKVRTAFEGKFSTKRDTVFWFTRDHRHVPVRVTADFSVGSVVVEMTGYRPGGTLASVVPPAGPAAR